MRLLLAFAAALVACTPATPEPSAPVEASVACCDIALPDNAVRNGKLVTLFGAGHYSAGSALIRDADASGACPCARAGLTFALGADHVVDQASVLPIGEACFPESAAEPLGTGPSDGRMFGAVLAADFCRDGGDELVLGALSDASNRLGHGDLRVFLAEAGWPDRELASGLSVFGLAAADLDLDGHLDLIVGTARDAASSAPERKVTGMPAGALDGATTIYYGAHTVASGGACHVRFERSHRIAEAQGVMSIRVADGNGDAWPDLLLAGRRVHLVLGGPAMQPSPIELSQVEARQIPATQYWYDLDALPLPDGSTLVAASRACFNQGECFKLFGAGQPMGLDTWVVSPAATPAIVHRFTPIEGLPGGLRFAEVDGAPGIDLLLGLLVSQAAGCPVLGKYCVGGAPRVVSSAASLARADAAVSFTTLDVGALSPMVGRVEPYLVPRPATCPAARVCDAVPTSQARGRFATYRGAGFPRGATFHATPCGRAGAALPTSFVPGDRFATTPDAAALSVMWTVDLAPPLLLNNPDLAGGNHLLFP